MMDCNFDSRFEPSTIDAKYKRAAITFFVLAPVGARDWSEVMPPEDSSGE